MMCGFFISLSLTIVTRFIHLLKCEQKETENIIYEQSQ